MNRAHIALISWLLIGLTSCATLDKNECLQGNWYRIGYLDGAKGYATTRMESHREACAEYGRGVHSGEYHQGWQRGVTYHCADSSAYKRTDPAIAADQGDWHAIGYSHGEAGQYYHPDRYRAQCAQYGIALQDGSYRAGYEQGIAQYCQPQRGYALGRDGQVFPRDLCATQEPALAEAYLRGLDDAVAAVDNEISQLIGKVARSFKLGHKEGEAKQLEQDLAQLRQQRQDLLHLRAQAPR